MDNQWDLNPSASRIHTRFIYEVDIENEKWLADFVEVHRWSPVVISKFMVMSHAHFPKITGMVFVDVGSKMMLTTRHTSSTGMLTMFTHAAVSGRDMSSTWRKMQALVEFCAGRLVNDILLSSLGLSSRHLDGGLCRLIMDEFIEDRWRVIALIRLQSLKKP